MYVDLELCIPELADQVACHWQEHVDLLRALALAFPARYPDLHAITDTDAELDFFNNVAHLQLHRRSRAFRRLANVGSPLLASHRNCLSDDAAMSKAIPACSESGHGRRDRVVRLITMAQESLNQACSSGNDTTHTRWTGAGEMALTWSHACAGL